MNDVDPTERTVPTSDLHHDTILEVNNLKTYFFTDEGIVRAVDGVSYSVRKGETLIVSLGKLGQAIANWAHAFGVEVIAYDPFLPADVALSLGVEIVSKAELLVWSDYV